MSSDYGSIQMIPISSSRVHSMGYSQGTMIVAFRNKKTGGIDAVCLYQDIDFDFYLEFLSSASKGRFVHDRFKGIPYDVIG